MENELKMLQRVKGVPNVIQINDILEVGDFKIAQLDYYSNGNLIELISNAGGKIPEDFVFGKVCSSLLQAVKALHKKKILHRNITPDNILLDEQYNLHLVDFSTAVDISHKEASGVPGTLEYLAPETFANPSLNAEMFHQILNSGLQDADFKPGYGASSEIWSIGVLLFECLTGVQIFKGDNQTEMARTQIELCNSHKHTNGQKVPDFLYDHQLSSSSAKFMAEFFQLDPGKRARSQDLLTHPFMGSFSKKPTGSDHSVYNEVAQQARDNICIERNL